MNKVWEDLLGSSPDELLAPLKHVADLGQESPNEAKVALDKLVRDEELMRGIVGAWGLDQEMTALLFERLAVVRGLQGRAERLRRLVVGLHRNRRALEAQERVAHLNTGDLREELAETSLPPRLVTPPGWEVRAEGLFRVLEDPDTGIPQFERIAPHPMLVTGHRVDVRTGAMQVQLAWPARHGWTTRSLPREEAMDPRGLIKLAAYHAPVSFVNARQLVQFLSDFESHNLSALPETKTSSLMGWLPGSPERFLWGDVCIEAGRPLPGPHGQGSSGGAMLLVEAGARQYADGWHSRGTWEGWLDLVALCQPQPGLWPPLYAALIPPLMRFLPRLHNFIIDLAGSTSLGKTTALRFAASAWGYPDDRNGGIIGSWASSRVWIESTSTLLRDLPLMLDDTKRVQHAEEVSRVVFEVAGGVGRGRGSPTGTRVSGHWRTVMLSTGEQGLHTFSEDGGTRARMLSFWGSPLGGESTMLSELAKRIEAHADQHYGHLGPRLVKLLVDNPNLRLEVERQWQSFAQRKTNSSGRLGVAQRNAAYLGGLEVAAWLVHEHLGVPRPAGDPLALAAAASEEIAREADRAAAALASTLSWATSQQHRFWPNPGSGHGGPELPPSGGWLGTWEAGEDWRWIGFLKDPLKRHLKERGHSPAAVLKRWSEQGWLLERPSRKDLQVFVGARQDYVVAIQREAARKVLEDGSVD